MRDWVATTSYKARAIPFCTKSYYVKGGFYHLIHMTAPQLFEGISKILYNKYVINGTLFKNLSEIDRACNERIEIIVSDMAKQEGVTEALKAADQMEWVSCMNSIRNRGVS